MKRIWKITSRVLFSLVLIVYIIVALVNYSVVQSYLGALAGNYFSKEWGGKVRIGSLHAMPFDHLILDDILWISPTNDTICKGESIRVTFNKFPFDGNGLDLNQVHLKNVYYHLAVTEEGINLKFLIDYFKSDKKKKEKKYHVPFYVKAKTLILEEVHYRMDLKDHRKTIYPYGVQIPHMEYYHINAKMKNIKVVEDDITCRIVRFATEEKSGFVLKDMAGNIHVSRYEIVAKNMKIETGASTIALDAELKYNTWKGIAGYVSTVQQKATLKEGTRVSMSDVAYWAPVLWGIDAVVEAEGTAMGTVDSLTTDMMFRWGDGSSALIAGTVMGLPRIDTTFFDINLEHLSTNLRDMAPLIKTLKPNTSLTKLLNEIGYMNLSATLKGDIKKLIAVNLLADCKMGQMRMDATLRSTPLGRFFTIDAGSDGMTLALLRSEWLTYSGFSLSTNGVWDGKKNDLSQWDRHLSMTIDGQLINSVVKGRRLRPATISGELQRGTLKALLESTDSLANLTLDLQAQLTDETKSYIANLSIDNLDMDILPRPLATTVNLDLHGNSLDDLSGNIKARMTRYGQLLVKDIDLTVKSDQYGKDIDIESDLADATVRGMFSYSDLPLMVNYFGQKYLPEMFNTRAPLDSLEVAALTDKTLAYHLRWLDDGNLLHKLTNSLTIAKGTRVDGSYNFGEQMKIVARSDSVRIGSVVIENLGINGRPIGDKYVLQTEGQILKVGRLELLERPHVTLGCTPAVGTVELSWGDNDGTSHGDVMMSFAGNRIEVMKPWFYVGSTPWKLDVEGVTLSKDSRLGIVGERIAIESQQQRIEGRVRLRGESDDKMELDFSRFSLDLLSDLMLQDTPLDVRGDINGQLTLQDLHETPAFNANLTIDSCRVNGQELGETQLTSHWKSELNMLNLSLVNKQIVAQGWLKLGEKDPGVNLVTHFHDFDLTTVQPVLKTFSSHFGGLLDGSITVGGTVTHPQIKGDAMVKEGAMKVDITDVTYSFSDSLLINNNIVTLHDFTIHDPLDNIAIANGTISLGAEGKVMLDLDVKTDNILLLDRKNGEQFYGRLFAGARGKVSGPVEHLDIRVQARTNAGCDLTVPISYEQRVKSQNFITFVGEEGVQGVQGVQGEQGARGDFDLTVDLTITPEMKLNLPMDFKEVSAAVNASGAGDLHMSLSSGTAPQIIGDYVISSGLMKVGLFSVYEKRFTIENGSSLNFQGSVPDARFDMQAVYSQRVNLSTLTGSLSSVDNTQKYLQVENVIAISGTMRDPAIKFDIRLPNADQSVEEEVFAYIDRNNERDMMNQTVSLLISGSFANVNSENSQGGGADALGVVTNFLGNSLTDMVQFVDVNIDYKSGNEYTNQQLDVNISKDWGRWYLESTLGYGGESRELEASTVNGAVIDALIGYRISPMFHLFAYNRTNTNDYTRIDLPYKQGVGLKLTKDFDRWRDLFKAKKNKKRKKKE